MFRVAPQAIDRRDAGFTIIEVLIALAVVAVSVIAIGSVMSTNVRGVRSLEQHVALMQTTRSVMTSGIPPRAVLAPGTVSGEEGGYRWTVDVGPMGGENVEKNAKTAWIPELVRVRVRSPSGAVSDLRTVRLIKGPSQ